MKKDKNLTNLLFKRAQKGPKLRTFPQAQISKSKELVLIKKIPKLGIAIFAGCLTFHPQSPHKVVYVKLSFTTKVMY